MFLDSNGWSTRVIFKTLRTVKQLCMLMCILTFFGIVDRITKVRRQALCECHNAVVPRQRSISEILVTEEKVRKRVLSGWLWC